MKTIKITILVLLLANGTLFSQLLSIPCVAYRTDRIWNIADDMGNILYQSNILLDVETYSEGFLSGYAFDRDNVVSIYYKDDGVIELKTSSEKALKFKNNRAFVVSNISKNEKEPEYIFGIIDRRGNYILEKKWMDFSEYTEGLAYIMNKEERGYVDTNGKFVFYLDSGVVGYGFYEGLSAVSNIIIDRFGYIDKTGKLVIDYKFYEAGQFSEGLARVFIPNKNTGRGGFGFINKNGILLIDNFYDETRTFNEGYNFVAIQEPDGVAMRWQIIDKDGSSKTELIFADCKDFSESVAAVKRLNDIMWYYIDTTFNPISNKYKFCGSFKNGKALVVDANDKKYFINKNSKLLFELPANADIILDCRTNEKYGEYK